MSTASVDLVLELAADTARLADQSRDGITDTAAYAMIEIVGQVRTRRSTELAEPQLEILHRKQVGEILAPNSKAEKGARGIAYRAGSPLAYSLPSHARHILTPTNSPGYALIVIPWEGKQRGWVVRRAG